MRPRRFGPAQPRVARTYRLSFLAWRRAPLAWVDAARFLRSGDLFVAGTRPGPTSFVLPSAPSGPAAALPAIARRSALRSAALARAAAASRRLTLASASSKTSALPALRVFFGRATPRPPFSATLALAARR